jgi:hypothetical protein
MEEAERLGLVKKALRPSTLYENLRWDALPKMREDGIDPFDIFAVCLKQYGYHNKTLQRALTAIGSGASPWAQLAYFLHSQSSA